MVDVLFVTPDSSLVAYQDLANLYSAVEPPTWSLLLASSVKKNGFDAAILDCNAEKLSLNDSVKRIDETNPRLIVFVLYGQNPNSGTTSMIGALQTLPSVKGRWYQCPRMLLWLSHSSSSSRRVIVEVSRYHLVE